MNARSQVFSDGSQCRPWQAQAQWTQCSQVQHADGEGVRIMLDGNRLGAIIIGSSPDRAAGGW
jgi:hypothetical protein